MIPRAYITAWRTSAPWPENEQVEQDLVLSRALVAPLLAPGSPWDVEHAVRYARDELLVRLPGDGWRGQAGEPEQ